MISGDIFNASTIAAAAGISDKTVLRHYSQLETEGAGLFIPPWELSESKASCFYFHSPAGPPRQHLFNALYRANLDLGEPWRLFHWRKTTGIGVDFIVESPTRGILCALTAHDRIPFIHT